MSEKHSELGLKLIQRAEKILEACKELGNDADDVYYLVSGTALEELKLASICFGMTDNLLDNCLEEMEKVEEACKANPIPK
jgi:hypothetical protein